MKETWTLSFLPALDDLEYGVELVASDWDPAITDESGMFSGYIRRYEIGSYVKTYSEHRYGKGYWGIRVKDKSRIWSVHLDSGECYQVYAYYKVYRWAYIPKI